MDRHFLQRIGCALFGASIGTVCCADAFDPAQQPFGYIAPVALSTSSLVRDARLFQPWFDPERWNGDLVAFAIDPNSGQPGQRIWSAASELLLRDWRVRRIITRRDDNGQAVAFRTLGDLSIDQQNALGDQARLDYLRGDTEGEGTRFRSRTHIESDGSRTRNILGALLHSNPVYVTAAGTERVFVGANDGMLHSFDAGTGREQFAYVPGMIYKSLAALTDTDRPVYSVDGTLAVAMVRFSDGGMHTVLVGGLGAGGQGLYALDISTATIDTESAALGTALWELDDAAEPALGYTYGTPVFVTLNDGQAAVLIGNGYVNAEPDAHTGSGTAQLLIIDAERGSVIHRIDTYAGSAQDNNGLSTPRAIDTNADGRVDFVYAGDLHGNLWRFDLRGARSDWGVSFSGEPLYSARSSTGSQQSITTAPVIIADPDQGARILFGTGRLLSDADLDPATGTGLNSLYGVRDRLGTSLPDADKTLRRALTERQYPDGQRVRTLGDASGSTPYDIWKVDLALGERVLTDPLLDSGRLTISVMQAFSPSGETWLLELDALSGGAAAQLVFDMNADGALDARDTLAAEGSRISAEDLIIGRYFGSGISSGPVSANLSATRKVTFLNRNEITQWRTASCLFDCDSPTIDDDPIIDEPIADDDTVADIPEIATDTGALLTPPTPCGTARCLMESRTNPGRISWKELLAD